MALLGYMPRMTVKLAGLLDVIMLEAAATVLAGEGHENKVYELSGKLRIQAELAAIAGEVLGRKSTYKMSTMQLMRTS